MKKCPFCAEEIQDAAIKCKHCGEWLTKKDELITETIKLEKTEIQHKDEPEKNRKLESKLCPICGGKLINKINISDDSWDKWCNHCKKYLRKNIAPIKPQFQPQPKPNISPTFGFNLPNREKPPKIDKLTEKLAREADQKQCHTCGKWDVYRAFVEDGGQGDWCPNCKKSLQKMRPALETKIKEAREAYIFSHRTILWLGIAIVLLMIIFPPWIFEVSKGGAVYRIDEKYGLLINPPGIEYHINLARLFFQCLIIVIIIGSVIFLKKSHIYTQAIKDGEHEIKECKSKSNLRKVINCLILGTVWLASAGLSASLVRSCLGSLNK